MDAGSRLASHNAQWGTSPNGCIWNHRHATVALGEEKQCLFSIASRRKSTNLRRRRPKSALPGSVETASAHPHDQREHDEITGHARGVTVDFRRRWGACFCGWHGRVLSRTTVFGAPEASPTVVPAGQALPPSLGTPATLDLTLSLTGKSGRRRTVGMRCCGCAGPNIGFG
jgi:hypothetical protein